MGTFDIQGALPLILPKAVEWAESEANGAMAAGRALDEQLLAIARKVGVLAPERIRIIESTPLPRPSDPLLSLAVTETGMFGPAMTGLTLGHAVFICAGHGANIRLLAHEFRHVCQYEQAGSIASFLADYLPQLATYGYWNSPLEVDARAHELLI